MRDWVAKLDGDLRLSEREILTHFGQVSHEVALAKAEAEFAKFRTLEAAKPSPVEKQLDEAVQKIQRLKPGKKKTPCCSASHWSGRCSPKSKRNVPGYENGACQFWSK